MSTLLAKSLYETWEMSITQNAQVVVKLYDEKAVLLPTVRGNYLNNKKDIERYFELFCALKPQATLINNTYQGFAEGSIIMFVGHYAFSFDQQTDAQARFSFAFRGVDSNSHEMPVLGENYYIIHHHSSILPEILL